MKKLIKMFKGLPPEMRMMIAMAGLGSPIGAIYALRRWVFPNTPTFIIILYVAGAIAVICLLAFIIAKLFGRGTKKRSQKMAADLAAGAESGPVSMDVRAAAKENNEKFFNAIKDMRKLGLSIYELPWYVVIGDSGCGKTRLINEGGLTFSTGKPEGYQLGTLNYNWWFTEDAIFVDMAGRLCNPKEDSDFREWDAFLSTVKKGRRGFPINGVLACVSADHLLQDAPEKLEADANTMLERLRDLQSKLGVTFATYLVITKCDKILGFMQYFDRAERDITIKNQIFGWSKPGDFKELYDPERFGGDFGELYGRLNALRLRRLNDDAEEIDLGLAYSFPEEFRGMVDPLKIYVRTLFPAIKNPRAIKNLIFRGVYFTSATQEGALILKHLTERLGADAASQFAPLDVYPNKRPHFIKDVFFRKVFPEHGLVFRNEEQADRNRKLAKLVNIGSGVLAVVLVALLWWSGSTFSSLIGGPREHAKQSVEAAQVTDAPSALRLANKLGDDADRLKANMLPARVLSLGFGTRAPITHLQNIQLGLFEGHVLTRALADVDEALRSTDLAAMPPGAEAEKDAKEYQDALEQYVVWYGCSGETSPPPPLTLEGFRTLCRAVRDPESIIGQEGFDQQATAYFAALGGDMAWEKNPARLLVEGDLDPPETIRLAIGHVHGYMMRFANLDKGHSNKVIQEWMRIQADCATIEERYAGMLDKAAEDIRTVDDVKQLREEFLEQFASFDEAFEGTEWRIGGGQYSKIASIKQAILEQRDNWRNYEQRLGEGFAGCETPPEDGVSGMITALSTGEGLNRPGLDQALWDSLKKAGLTQYPYNEENYQPEKFDELVEEVHQAYGHIITIVPGEGADPDRIDRTADAVYVRKVLKQIRDTMAEFDPGSADSSSQTLDQWNERLDGYLEARGEQSAETGIREDFDRNGKWRRSRLEELYGSHEEIVRRGSATRLLNTIRTRLDSIGSWGLAEVAGGDLRWCGEQTSSYRIEIPPCGKAVERKPARATRDEKERPKGRRGRRRRGRSSARSTSDRATTTSRRTTVRTAVPNCATREFLNEVIEQWADVQYNLGDFNESDFLSSGEEAALNVLCSQQIDEAGRKYFESYVRGWSRAYGGKTLSSLEKLKEGSDSWRSLVRKKGYRTNVDNELQDALKTILGALPFWSAYEEEQGRWSIEEGDDFDAWMTDALEQGWGRELGDFVYARELPSDYKDGEWFAGDPAGLVADDFVNRWNALSNAIESNDDFRKRWSLARQSRNQGVGATRIPWGEIQSLREQTGLAGEKLTGQLADFEEHTKYLLSVELSDILNKIQYSYFRDQATDEGWPFVSGAGRNSASLETVKLEGFAKFLVEVGRAETEFSMLEQGFEDELAQARVRFYNSCRQWRAFLGLEEDGTPSPLSITVWGGDPLSDPKFKARVDDTAQLYYRTVELYLGDLTWTEEQSPGGGYQGSLRRTTEVEGRATRFTTEWDWSQAGERGMAVMLRDGENIRRSEQTRQDVEQKLGRLSPLALCAYLQGHHYPGADRKVWKTLHTFALEVAGEQETKVGEMFVFKLDRAMPEPIRRLSQPETRR